MDDRWLWGGHNHRSAPGPVRDDPGGEREQELDAGIQIQPEALALEGDSITKCNREPGGGDEDGTARGAGELSAEPMGRQTERHLECFPGVRDGDAEGVPEFSDPVGLVDAGLGDVDGGRAAQAH